MSQCLRAMALVTIALACGPLLFAQTDAEYRNARTRFSKAARDVEKPSKGEKDDALKNAIASADALAATGAEAAMKDLLGELDRLDKALLKQDKAVEQVGKTRRDIWDSIDKQAAKGRPVSAGSATSAIEKERELIEKEQALAAERDRLLAWKDALIGAGGKLLRTSDASGDLVLALATDIEKARDDSLSIPRVRILAGLKNEVVRASLAGFLLGSKFEAVRVASADALGELGLPASHTALISALKDEAWPVAVASVRALVSLARLDAVDALLAAAEGAEGRMKAEIVETLEDLTGHRAGQNIGLWKEYWQSQGTTLKATLEQLGSDDEGQVLSGLTALEQSGPLAGAALLMARLGLVDSPIVQPLTDEALRVRARAAIGQVLSTRAKALRERSAKRLLLTPLVARSAAEDRVALIGLAGRVQADAVRERLILYVGQAAIRKPGTEGPYSKDERDTLRLAAVQAIGYQGSQLIVPVLREILSPPSRDRALLKAAIESLGHNNVKESITVLIKDGFTATDDEANDWVAKALEQLTDQRHGKDSAAWNNWWRTAEASYKPRGDTPVVDDRLEAEARTTGFYGIETQSKHILYIIDRSGSMNEADASGGTRWATLQKELIQSIRSLKDDGSFNLVFYNHEYSAWKKGMIQSTPDNRSAAIKFIESTEALGNTNIFDPLAYGLDQARLGQRPRYGDPIDTIFFLSDGQPNRGDITDPEQILKEVGRRNESLKVQIHAIGIGQNHDQNLMRRLAESNGGQYVAR